MVVKVFVRCCGVQGGCCVVAREMLDVGNEWSSMGETRDGNRRVQIGTTQNSFGQTGVREMAVEVLPLGACMKTVCRIKNP